jgi:hypothetical protein
MIPSYKNKSNLFILLYFASLISWAVFSAKGMTSLSSFSFLLSTPLLITGCYFYGKGKGYNWFVCLLGLFSLLGLIVLVALPDKQKTEKEFKHL